MVFTKAQSQVLAGKNKMWLACVVWNTLVRGNIGEVGRGQVTKPLSAILKTVDFIL